MKGTYHARRTVCDHVGYGHRGIVRCLKNENRTISPLIKLSYGAGRICDWAISTISLRLQQHADFHGSVAWITFLDHLLVAGLLHVKYTALLLVHLQYPVGFMFSSVT